MEIRYKVVERIGEGGMGEVYRAEDLVLRRPVALKVLSGRHLDDPQARARFLRESRIAASLNHPNICTIHEVGEIQAGEPSPIEGLEEVAAGTPFIVMELVEGQTLDRLIGKRGGLSVSELLRIAVQMAEAAAEAHAKGIVHRDLKPQNVVVGPQGRVKVLDFGLAKPLTPPQEGDLVLTDAAKASVELTLEGMVLGTVAYMSPEQAQGQPVDSRSDVFAFGVVLYEMATQRRAFPGDTAATVMAKILETDPEPVSSIRPDLPAEYGRIVRRCLKKAPEERFNDTRDLVAALKDLRQETSSAKVAAAGAGETAGGSSTTTVVARRLRSVRPWLWASGLVLVVVAAFLVGRGFLATPAAGPLPGRHRQITFTGNATTPAISPDGQHIAYFMRKDTDNETLVVQDTSGGRALEIFAGRGLSEPRWSPDGKWLLIVVLDEEEKFTTYMIPRLGGEPRRLAEGFPNPVWGADGKHYAGAYQNWNEIRIRDLEGRTKVIPLGLESIWTLTLDWSHATGRFSVVTRAIDEPRFTLWTIGEDGKDREMLLESDEPIAATRWSSRGDAVYYLLAKGQTRELWKIPVDAQSGRPTGTPRQLMALLQCGDALSLSSDGTRLVYRRRLDSSNLWVVPLSGEAPKTPRQLTKGTLLDGAPAISPDGTQVAFSRARGEETDVFVVPLAGGAPRRVSFGASVQARPVWSPDGTEIAYGCSHEGTNRVWRIAARGGTPRPFANSELSLSCCLAWAPSRRILYQIAGNQDFRFLDPDTEEEELLFGGDRNGWPFEPVFSPDGNHLAFFWNRKGGQRLWLVSLKDGSQSLAHPDEWAAPLGWSPDSRWVFALVSARRSPRIIRLPVSGGEVKAVVDLPFDRVHWAGCKTSPDGKTAVVSVVETQSDIWLVEDFDPDVE